MFDQLVMLGAGEAQLDHAAVAIEDAELELLITNESSAVRALLNVHTGPRVKLVGDLIDELWVGHAPIVLAPPSRHSSDHPCPRAYH